MRNFNLFFASLAAFGVLAAAARAQNAVLYAPPPPVTRLEMLETNTGVVLIKATEAVGSVSTEETVVSVKCKEYIDTGTGRKEHGIVIGLAPVQQPRMEDRTMVDYDELGPLLHAMDALATIDWSVTSLGSFDAVFQTAAGFRVAAFSVRRSGTVEHSVRSSRMSKGLVLTSSQWAELRGLIDQARRKLDSLRVK